MKRLFIVIAFLIGIVQFTSAAVSKAEADKDYQENKFADAIEKYEAILSSEGESADIYYNLGNSYYKNKNIAKAVLNYDLALLMNPGDSDIRFIVTWINSLINCMSESGWGVTGIVSFILLLAGMALYIFGNRILFKKIGFISAVVFLIVAVCANFFASEQKEELLNRTGAIVMSPSITVKSTPNESGTDLFVLHEGTKVYIEDNSMKGWKEIRLEDGKKGRLPVSAIEVI